MIRLAVTAKRSALAVAVTCATVVSPLVAQIPEHEYADRRARLAARAGEGVVLVVGSATSPLGHAPFRYLTGIGPADAILAVAASDGVVSAMLFADSTLSAIDGMDTRDIERLAEVLQPHLDRHANVSVAGAYELARNGNPATARLSPLLERPGRRGPWNANSVLDELRGIKSPAEQALIRRAAEITAAAHNAILDVLRPGTTEADVKELIDAAFRREGADERPAFGHIVASGPNSTILHYMGGDRRMERGDLVKVDIGAAYAGYAADVTRTYPVGGRFTAEQRAIYRIVRDAQYAAEKASTLYAPRARASEAADSVLAGGLASLGLIEAADATYECETRAGDLAICPQLHLYYWHSLGHGIGLLFHDPTPETLEPGSAFSIEPGIYVRPDLLGRIPDTPANQRMAARIRDAFQRYAGIGIRIEDDYIMTEAGLEWISRAPRELREIEDRMARPAGRSPQ